MPLKDAYYIAILLNQPNIFSRSIYSDQRIILNVKVTETHKADLALELKRISNNNNSVII